MKTTNQDVDRSIFDTHDFAEGIEQAKRLTDILLPHSMCRLLSDLLHLDRELF
jgi:hypothetical protein